MIAGFKDARTADLWTGVNSARVRRIPADVIKRARLRLAQLDSARIVQDMAVPPGNNLEQLVGDRAGQWSVRVNDQWRICFRWRTGEVGPKDVEFTDYHG